MAVHLFCSVLVMSQYKILLAEAGIMHEAGYIFNAYINLFISNIKIDTKYLSKFSCNLLM